MWTRLYPQSAVDWVVNFGVRPQIPPIVYNMKFPGKRHFGQRKLYANA